jgi:dihydropteroate synthase
MRAVYQWNLGRRTLELGRRTLVMGVVNVTPDSFSDGGQFSTTESAIARGLALLDEGADIVDVGGESTRPGVKVAGASAVSLEDELARVLPVIEGLRRVRPAAVISIDTYKSEVARRAVDEGAEIVNDVSGFAWDPAMAKTVAGLGCGAVLMHVRGRPEQWRTQPPEPNIVELVHRELAETAQRALDSGVAHDSIVLDPGFGFGKNFDENYPLLANLGTLAELGYPLLVGTSRKSFLCRTVARRLAELSGQSVPDLRPDARLTATVASVTAAVLNGAHLVRVHDVRPAVEAVAIADAVLNAEDRQRREHW